MVSQRRKNNNQRLSTPPMGEKAKMQLCVIHDFSKDKLMVGCLYKIANSLSSCLSPFNSFGRLNFQR